MAEGKAKQDEKLTPMLKQYIELKERYSEYILFYRLGDFYEMFYEDANLVSRELELTLTARAGVPMCGVPHHSSITYLKRLVNKGYKIAICEQLTDPSVSKGIVERDVVRIVTAGTLTEDELLDESTNNFISSIYLNKKNCGLVFSDISTGEIHAFEITGKHMISDVKNELSRYTPVEVIFNEEVQANKELMTFLSDKLPKTVGEILDDTQYQTDDSQLINHFFVKESDDIINLHEYRYAYGALFAMLRYLYKTRKNDDKCFTNIVIHKDKQFMNLNLSTRRNLELVETMRSGERKGSLMWVLDKTKTSMGKRKLKQYIERPLINQLEIIERHDAVSDLVKNTVSRIELGEALEGIYDIERLMSRVIYKTASPRDIFALGKTFGKIPEVKNKLSLFSAPLLLKYNSLIDEQTEISTLVENAISPEPPALIKDGNYIKDGFNDELDRLRRITKDAESVLREIEENERTKTGIKTLKVGYNRVFGYYIEVSKGNVQNVPDYYIRKQTLTNGERYITEELKNIENEIIGAKDKILVLESEIFSEVRTFIAGCLEKVMETADALANIDVLCSFAFTAIENNYNKPDITLENVIEIHDGRHPVIEKIQKNTIFTPNDTLLDTKENKLIIITGPNMAGKSTYMRQVAIITLMAQIGSFVPAKTARIGVVDQIFTRVGASDDLASGQSTFMVEMNEVAEILREATSKSLVILDEIGRGTSTFDGISIAKAVAEYINSKAIGCKTLFATHYHELISLEEHNVGIKNYSVSAIKKGDTLTFLHKVLKGGVDESYGIEVAKLAGLPEKVIESAKKSLEVMERNTKIELAETIKNRDESQVSFDTLAEEAIISKLRKLDINTLTPMDAFNILADIKKDLN